MDWVDLDTTPLEEKGERLGENYDPARARAEARAYIKQLMREYGEPPPGARFKVVTNVHSDFGSYYSVRCVYDTNDDDAETYAFLVEDGCDNWDAEARRELGIPD